MFETARSLEHSINNNSVALGEHSKDDDNSYRTLTGWKIICGRFLDFLSIIFFFFQKFMSGNIAMAISVSKNLRLSSRVCLCYDRWSAASGKRSVEYHSTSFIYGKCFTAQPFN